MIKLYKGDCLVESDKIESGSVDLILTDLPYGTMEGQSDSGIYHQGKEKHEWDNIIPTDKIMQIANRMLRKNGKMILFAQEPFTNKLMNSETSNISFNYRAIWLKDTLGSFMRSKKALLYKTEDILIFTKTIEDKSEHPLQDYFYDEFIKSGISVKEYCNKLKTKHASHFFTKGMQFRTPNENYLKQLQELTGLFNITIEEVKQKQKEFLEYNRVNFGSTFNLKEGDKYKSNIFEFKRDRDNYHPTQKPVLLLEDLIRTFSNENDLVVDFTMGSGSTMLACKNLNRNGIGIEKEENYFKIAQERINSTLF